MSVIENMIEETGSSDKEYVKSKKKKNHAEKIQEIWDTIKRPNQRIIGIKEGKDSYLKGPEKKFNNIIEENFPSLKKHMHMKV